MDRFLFIMLALAILAIVSYVRERIRCRRNKALMQAPVSNVSFLPSENHLNIGVLDVPPAREFLDIAKREDAIARLSTVINRELQALLERDRSLGPEHLATVLIESVEYLVLATLKSAGYGLACIDYDGDINYEKSGQTYANGGKFGTGLTLEFRGFSCKVSWVEHLDAS